MKSFVSSSVAALPATSSPASPVAALRIAAWLGAGWNLFGVSQWLMQLSASDASLMASGLTAEQAALYLQLPAWMSVTFAGGVGAGLAGALALAFGRSFALPLLAVSLAAYAVLFAGDAYFGLFAAMPRQLAVLSLVMLIAVALLALAVHARRAGSLR